MSQPPEPDAHAEAPTDGVVAAPPPAPETFADLDEDLDDRVGMASPAALAGVPVAPPPMATIDPGPAPAPAVAPEPLPESVRAARAFGRRPPVDVLAEPGWRALVAAYVLLVGVVLTLGAGVPGALLLLWREPDRASDWLLGHRVYLLRTVWTTAVAGLIGLLTVPVGLGVFVLTVTAVWCVVRAAAGLPRLIKGQALDDPRSWTLP